MTTQYVPHAERLAAAKQHLAMADRAWPRLVADSRRPSLAWGAAEPAAEMPATEMPVTEMDEMSLVKLAISWTG